MNLHMPVQHENYETDNGSDYDMDVSVENNSSVDSPLTDKQDIDATGDYIMDVESGCPPILVETKGVDSRKSFADMVPIRESYTRDKSHQYNHCEPYNGETRAEHTGECPYQSSHCDTNQGTHTGGNIHRCSHCRQCFDTKSVLIQHLRACTGEKPYHNGDASQYVTIDFCQPHVHSQNSYNNGEDTKQSIKYLASKNNAHDGILTEQNKHTHKAETDTSINGYVDVSTALPSINGYVDVSTALPSINGYVDVSTALPDQNSSDKIPPVKVTKFVTEYQNCCIFCLDGGNLIHMCSCSVLAHKECALEYIRFPGSMNDCCCQCRKELKYTIEDGDTPMKAKYVIAFLMLVIGYCAIVGLSIYLTLLMIPGDGWNKYVHWTVIANLSILWPLLIVYILSLVFECCLSPRNRTTDTMMCSNSGCYCSGGCGDLGCGDLCGADAGGDACCGIICVILFLAILAVLIAASAYLVMSLYKHYKSFALKSKNKIVFKDESRPINTADY